MVYARSPNKSPEPTLGLGLRFRMRLLRSSGPLPSRSRLVRNPQRGSSLTLGASAPIAQFTSEMRSEKTEPGACETAEVRDSLPAIIPGNSNPRIGREVLAPKSGDLGLTVVACAMGYARSPNQSPEPTLGLGLRFRMRLLRSTGPLPSRSRLVRNPSVAHL